MSLIGIILLFLFIWYVVRPAVKFFMTVNRLRDQARSAYQNRWGGSQRQSERKAGWTAPVKRKKKKIDRNVGEYIEYEEITHISASSESTTSGQTRYSSTEEQVTDVEWEDINIK